MSSFTENTKIMPMPKENKRVTVGSFIYRVGYEESSDEIVIHAGFEFDGASIPYFLGWFGQKVEPKTIGPACVHDFLYINKSRSRKEADQIFFEALVIMGVSKIKALLYYLAVRGLGWYVWNRGLNKVLSSKK